MITEKEVIEKIQILKQIKPEKNWVFLTKEKILGKEPSFFPFFRPAFSVLFVSLVLLGLSFTSLPGEPFYPIKKLVEKSQKVLVPEEEKPKVDLELANKRLEELSKVAEKNDVKKIVPALSEAKETVAQATKNLVKSKKLDKEIVQKTLEFETKKQKVEKVLGTKITEEETENPTKFVASYLIETLSKKDLTQDQAIILEKAKENFENRNYSKVLELLLPISQ